MNSLYDLSGRAVFSMLRKCQMDKNATSTTTQRRSVFGGCFTRNLYVRTKRLRTEKSREGPSDHATHGLKRRLPSVIFPAPFQRIAVFLGGELSRSSVGPRPHLCDVFRLR